MVTEEQRDNKPRLSIEISSALRDRIDSNVSWGIRAALFRKVIENTMALIEKHGHGVISLLIMGDAHLSLSGGSNGPEDPED